MPPSRSPPESDPVASALSLPARQTTLKACRKHHEQTAAPCASATYKVEEGIEMKKSIASLVLLGALTLGGAGVAQAAPVSDGTADPLIVGGEDTTISAAPFAARIFLNGSFNCSASQISSEWVLTARHCGGQNMTVGLGSAALTGGKTVGVTQQVPWSGGDLLLVKLSSPTPGSYASLEKDALTQQTNAKLFGWGRETATGPASDGLKVANVRVDAYSTDAYGGTALRNIGIDGQAWKGDSGGPMVVNGILAGVASTSGSGGETIRSYSNYTSIPHAMSWITATSGVVGQ